ncbi:MAG TPA: NF038122 family metalloprotease [Sphingomonas sp.]|uniref:NF038122 family metalloprotease n=1 Tax=Sphingomonas sp. TaxID=28214 RepID=UPI002C4D3637|nr:NF038122 family metalloprotease [Sphingomonas sp.]HMI19214.1 NF038122 family metalloprotease [Sphingomonas sp.]
MYQFRRFVTGAAFVASMFGAQEVSALTINLIDYNNTVTGTAAKQDLDIAAYYWSSLITTNATVTIQVGYGALGTNVIASTSSNSTSTSAADVYLHLAATGNSALDAVAITHLQPLDASGGLSFITNSNAGNVISKTAQVYDNDDSANNRQLDVNTSVMKALGYTGYNQAIDARITLSSAFAFDLNPSNGIAAGHTDFIAIAIHEMGHALGFTSGVDDYDLYAAGTKSPYTGLSVNLNASAEFSTLDLFRYSNDPGNLAPGAGPALDLSTGGTPYFSIDGTAAFNGAYFATGKYAGDGRQASHFKDSTGCGAQIGIMDPTFCKGQMGVVTDNDIAAIDALGWNINVDALQNFGYSVSTAQIYAQFVTPPPSGMLMAGAVPEPASWAMMLVGFGLIGAVVRQGRRGKPLFLDSGK